MQLMSKKSVAMKLRVRGFSYGEISDTLGVAVSKGTLSGWCKGIAIGERERKNLAARQVAHLVNTQRKSALASGEKRLHRLQEIRKLNSAIVRNFDNIEVAKIALAMLYLGEGSKGERRGFLTFCNSDPSIIRLFISLLRSSYVLNEQKFRVTVQCRADQDIGQLEKFWSEVTSVPLHKFKKAQVDMRSAGKPTLKSTYKGVCRLDYFSTVLFNELTIIAGLISEGR